MGDHYFSAQPAAGDVRRDVNAHIWGREYTFTTARGVFARDGLDKATAVLLDTCDPPRTARTVLDLGCGWGPVACAIARECSDVVVHAVDTNERALDLVRRNADRLGVRERVLAYAPDEAPATTYDEIWSNPPIRIGKPALHELLLTWLARLSDGGVARLVVGKNLGSDSLQRWLIERGYPTERITSAKGFRVLEARSS
ncbi:class I SAM-dependent methyltransferase [Solicola gregarius]|uniref:Class I SAM-dependent methyltransferase n=1 Tax=Solicola gregarius TaxID=2908642 RepID=A0AA46TEC9_9ACTN|nr:methyltransferase [Solicola gregarius]UYM03802.1 class I SAM-dependent methyltransferase [Solicola gregarius]